MKVNDRPVSRSGKTLAEWLVKKLNGKGNVVMVTGVAGTEVDLDRNKGADEVWAKNPGIKVVNRYTGMWDSSTAERNTAAILPSLPKIDGVWCQGGTDGVIKAFIAANRPLPKVAGEAENGFRKFMIGYDGSQGGRHLDRPAAVPVGGQRWSWRGACSRASYPKKDVHLPLPIVTSDTVKVGETVFPDQPDSFFADFTDCGPHPIVKLCLDAALDGKPCGGTLAVNLPAA